MARVQEKYILDNEGEMTRLHQQHRIFKDALGGLIYAPINVTATPLRILDSGCADGFWLQDLRSSLPSPERYTLIGTDIDPSKFPRSPPVGMSFHVQSVRNPWPPEWHNSFDLVNQRFVLAAATVDEPHLSTAIKSLAGLVKPGGWIQLIEGENVPFESDGPAYRKLMLMLGHVLLAMGSSPKLSGELQRLLKDANVVDIEDHVHEVHLGAKNANAELREISFGSSVAATKGLAEVAKTLPTLPPTFVREDLDTLPDQLKDELQQRGGTVQTRVVYGRKQAQ